MSLLFPRLRARVIGFAFTTTSPPPPQRGRKIPFRQHLFDVARIERGEQKTLPGVEIRSPNCEVGAREVIIKIRACLPALSRFVAAVAGEILLLIANEVFFAAKRIHGRRRRSFSGGKMQITRHRSLPF